MDHPVFDALSYPWHLEPARQFYGILTQVILKQQDIDTIYKRCGQYAVEIPTININTASGDLWKEVLEKLAGVKRLKQLCGSLRQEPQLHADVAAMIVAVENLKLAVSDPEVDVSLVMLNRKSLREYLKLLANDEEFAKVLLVRGKSKSGKTFSRLLFEKMARQRGAEPVYLFPDIAVNIQEVLQELFGVAGGPGAVPTVDTTQPGWHSKVCRELRDIAVSKQKNIWIAIDDLGDREDGAPAMDKEIRDFFNQFVLLMTGETFRRRFKLLLINYPQQDLPSNWHKQHVLDEWVKEDDITQDDIKKLIEDWCTVKKKNIHQTIISQETARIITGAGDAAVRPAGTPRLEWIQNEVSRYLKTL